MKIVNLTRFLSPTARAVDVQINWIMDDDKLYQKEGQLYRRRRHTQKQKHQRQHKRHHQHNRVKRRSLPSMDPPTKVISNKTRKRLVSTVFELATASPVDFVEYHPSIFLHLSCKMTKKSRQDETRGKKPRDRSRDPRFHEH